MKKLLSPYCSKAAHNIATLILRLCLAIIIIPGHGWEKLTQFSEKKEHFMDFMGIGMTGSLALATFAEFFCALLVVLGLVTRFASLIMAILFTVIVTKVHGMDVTNTAQLPFALWGITIAILFLGPGKISIDGLISKK